MGHRRKAMQMDGEGGVLRSCWDEEISDRGEDADETLQFAWRAKSLHHPLPFP